MRVLALLCVVLCGICGGNAASHSLKYISTAVTGDTDSLDFTIMGLVDDEQFVHYDSNSRRMIPKTEWMEKSVNKQYWDKQTQKALYAHQIFKDNIGIAMQHYKSTQGQHILEWTVDCEWDNTTRTTRGIERYVYDRERFRPDAIKNWSFIPPAQQLFISAVKWNPAELENDNQTQTCIESLKKYVSYRRGTLERTVAPEVSLLQKDSSSPVVTCHVTGFFPRDIMVTWQRNGKDLDVGVELGETVSNENGTFQTTSNLTVKPEDWKSQNYTCTVQHKSLKQDIVLPVKEENIKRNTDIKTHGFSPEGSSPPMGVIIGCVVGALILILAVIGVVMWRRRSSDYGRTSTSDPEFPNSNNMQLQSRIQQTPDQPAATDTDSGNSTQPAATDTDSGNSTQPAATDTDSGNSTQPAATDTDSGNSDKPAATDINQPAATDTGSGNSTQPAATYTGSVNSNKPAATDTDSVNSNQPAATDTSSMNSNRPAATDSNQPAATDTGSVNSNQPAATGTDSVNSNQPAATDTDSVNSSQTAATDTDSVNSNQPAVSQAFPAPIGVLAPQGVLATKKQINVPYEHKTGS